MNESLHTWVELGSFLTSIITTGVVLLIKFVQASIKEDVNAKHAENKRIMDVHIAEDTKQFQAIGETLNRIDTKVDKLDDKIDKRFKLR